MSTFLTFSVRLLDGRYHARIERGREPEWPPSPMRLFQAIVAGAAPRWHTGDVRDRERSALLWLERQPAPTIVTPAAVHHVRPLLTYVPNNNDPATNERTAKTIEPTVLESDHHIEWRYAIDPANAEASGHAQVLTRMVRHISHIGWGIDMAVGYAKISDATDLSVNRVVYTPTSAFAGDSILRMPTMGTLESLEVVHQSKLERFGVPGVLTLRDVQPTFAEIGYGQSVRRNFIAFRFMDENDEDVAYRIDHIKAISGRIRNVVAASCKGHFAEEIINGMILGHPQDSPRLSILLIPSIGHRHADGRVRRVIFAEPIGGNGNVCERLRDVLDQYELDFNGSCPCPPARLVALSRGDSVVRRFSACGRRWASVTPVLLPGHNQRKQDDRTKAIVRAQRLVAKSLQQAGITTPAEFEVDRVPYWPGTRHAREYDPRDKLAHLPRYHVRITFQNNVTGPLSIGAGRHVGFGVFAACDEE